MSNSSLSASRLTRMHDVMAGHVQRGHVPGLVALVSHGGETYAEAFGKRAINSPDALRRNDIFRIASLTKPITAAAAMLLVEECRLRLDDPVDPLLPELASRRVLRRISGPVDDTVPANRAITLRDLLTLRLGLGYLMAPAAADYPIRKLLDEQQLLLGPPNPSLAPAPDEWMRRLGNVPLMHQPGEQWMYDIGLDVLGVLIARAAGMTLDAFMRERIFEPLGMQDTGFSVPAAKSKRFTGCYYRDPATGELQPYDDPADSPWSRPPAFASGGGGLVSTIDDYLAFCQMMLGKGRFGGEQILSCATVELMTTDQLTAAQRESNCLFFDDNSGWGFGLSVITRRDNLHTVPGRFGWTGGLGASAYTDPQNDLIGILMTTRMMDSPQQPAVFSDFWTCAYQSVNGR